MIDLKEVLLSIVSPIVTKPDEVKITEKNPGSRDVLLQLSVAPEDMGKVIGRHGKIAKAIRTVMKAAAVIADVHVRVDILDKDEMDAAPADSEEN